MYIEYNNIDRETAEVLTQVIGERRRQNHKWGVQNHLPDRWLRILAEEIGEAAQALESRDAAMRNHSSEVAECFLSEYETEMIQVAAVAAAAVECCRRNR